MATQTFHWRQLEDPVWFHFMSSDITLAPLWALARLYVGWQWLQAGWEKANGDGWLNQDGSALESFWQRIVAIPASGRPAISYDWYRSFIQFMLDHDWYTWFAWLITFGELLVGIALIVGAFTGIAALFGATMNFSFLMAGSASINPVMLLLSILMVLGWKVAGFIGVDRWLLPALGTPWQVGPAFRLLRGSREGRRATLN
jgi:thiosulfate dehydrogenase [quinone] large subunit